MARDSRHFWALRYKSLKGVKMINVSYILTPYCIYLNTVVIWICFISMQRYKRSIECARSARKFLSRGGTKVGMGGYSKFWGWGGTGLHGGVQPLDGGGSPPIPPHS